MYFVVHDRDGPIAHASLEAALKTLRGELQVRQTQGWLVTFTDQLEFEIARPDGNGKPDGQRYRMWIEDESGQRVTSKDAAEAG